MNQGMAVNPGAILIIVLVAVTLIAFWRTLIKIVIALMATGIVLVIAYTAIMIYQKAHGIA